MGGQNAMGLISALGKGGSSIAALIGAGGNYASGSAAGKAAEDEAKNLYAEGDLLFEDHRLAAEQKAREVREFEATQALAYSGSGVTLEGSPALQLERTRRLGQQEINALMKRGQSMRQLYRQKGMQTMNAGRAALFGGQAKAASGLFQQLAAGAQIGIFGNKETAPANPPYVVKAPVAPTDHVLPRQREGLWS